ncbi:hypothetical protein EXIGLDRAFT_736202 [Exidia glandulosa HHB12029]|uniref:F-box domain-containing protein n=1 Tax=Exidia glandulosa HHB12029 TaxID=1314781 RepID=A0A166ATB9_EXIGL|nr:hypothetical protein EXIGLDRAFT_736202 [Exidia glandulosa HHB12029]
MSCFDLCPDELVVRVLDELDPNDVLSTVACLSRRFSRIAQDDGLWWRFCARALAVSTTERDAGFRRDAWMHGARSERSQTPPLTPLDFWKRFLRVWAPRLGWWAEMDGAHGAIFRIAADMTAGILRCDQVVLINELDTDDDGNRHIPLGVVLDRSVLSIATDSDTQTYLDIHLLQPAVQFQDTFTARFDVRHGAILRANGHNIAANSVYHETIRPWILLDNAPRPPFPTPALILALRDPPPRPMTKDWMLRTLQFRYGPRHLIPLRNPAELDDEGPVRTGWYSGTYGAHGCEFVYIRTVDAADTFDGVNWPWDTLPASAPTTGRFLEAIKLTGDPNIPKGQRSFVGFLSSPETRSGTGPIPDTSERSQFTPWPMVPQALPNRYTRASVMQDYYGNATGVTAPGYARIAARWFRDPRWTPCIVHVASRVEVELFWTEMGIVTTFRYVDLN